MADSICRPNARSYVVIEDEYHFLLISDDYKLFRQRYVAKQLPPYDETHSGLQKCIDLLKTTDVWCGLLYLSCIECDKETNLI